MPVSNLELGNTVTNICTETQLGYNFIKRIDHILRCGRKSQYHSFVNSKSTSHRLAKKANSALGPRGFLRELDSLRSVL